MRRATVITLFTLLTATIAGSQIASALPSPPGAEMDPLLGAALVDSAPDDLLQVAVVFDGAATTADLDAIASVDAIAVPFAHLPMAAVQGTPAQLLAVAGLPGVDSLWLNHDLELLLGQSGDVVQATDVRDDLGLDGSGVAVAVIDSGIDGFHPDLAFPEHTVQNVKLLGYQKVFSDALLVQEGVTNTDTTTGHGTHVAGIIAGTGAASDGTYVGMAPGADLVGLGAADGTDLLTGLAAYDWVLGHHDQYGIRVINNSWGDGTVAYDPDDPLNVASKAAYDAGITVVFAAGNDGESAGKTFNRYAWPEWVISVAGGDKLGRRASYSSRGDAVHHPTVVAPGSFIASARAVTGVVTDANSTPFDFTDPLDPRMVAPEHTAHYTVALGTSMAAPHVAGIAALMLEANPGLTPDDLHRLLAETATPMTGCSIGDCGAGYVNALGAVQAALASVNQPPVAILSATPAVGAAPLTVTFDASASEDADGSIVAYAWDFDADGNTDLTTADATTQHTYPAGAHLATVSVVDDGGRRSLAADTVTIRASSPPDAQAAAPKHAKSGEPATFDGSASTDPDGHVVHWAWTFGDGTSADGAVMDHTYVVSRPTLFAWTLTVTDDAGVSAATSGTIKVTPKGPAA